MNSLHQRLLTNIFPKRVCFALTAVIGSVIAILILFEIVFRLLPTNQGLLEMSVNREHPIKRFQPNQHTIWSKGWNFSIVNHVSTNNVGFVNEHDYVRRKDGVRLAVIGDSYVEALMLPYSETFHASLAASLQGTGTVYSFGTSGSALSQYLIYAQYAREAFDADGMIFTIISNDFDESVCRYKDYPTYHCFEKDGGAFRLKRHDWQPNPWALLLRKSALCNYVIFNLNIFSLPERIRSRVSSSPPPQYFQNTLRDTTSERLHDAQQAIDTFFSMLPTYSGKSPEHIAFVVDGMRAYIYDPAEFPDIRTSYFFQMREYFLVAASARRYQVLDMQPVFEKDFQETGERFEFPSDGHWNAHAHQVVATAIMRSAYYRSLFSINGRETIRERP